MIERHDVVQSYLDLFEDPRYLEIGVSKGITFHALRARRKVAVDPKFEIPLSERQAQAEYHEVTSDVYFQDLITPRTTFDVIYLDGLHTFEQTLRDLMNALEHLSEDGVIIVDDVLPTSYHASLKDQSDCVAVRNAISGSDPSWMGDTFRLVYFVETFMPAFDYATVRDNHGQLVMWRCHNARKAVHREMQDIANYGFRDVILRASSYRFKKNEAIVVGVRMSRLVE